MFQGETHDRPTKKKQRGKTARKCCKYDGFSLVTVWGGWYNPEGIRTFEKASELEDCVVGV